MTVTLWVEGLEHAVLVEADEIRYSEGLGLEVFGRCRHYNCAKVGPADYDRMLNELDGGDNLIVLNKFWRFKSS